MRHRKSSVARRRLRLGLTFVLPLLIALCIIQISRVSLAVPTYYIDECVTFPECGGEDVNTITYTLKFALAAAGWTGSRYTGSLAWPQDFWDKGVVDGGLDHSFADNNLLSVYAGHGTKKRLWYGYKHDGQCFVDAGAHMRLGTLWGNKSAYGMFLTCCTLHQSMWGYFWGNQVFQLFGFHGVSSIGDYDPEDWFNATWDMSNKDAWVDVMEDRPGWFTGDNSLVILSFGQTAAGALNVQANCWMKWGTCLHTPAEPWYWYAYTLVDHGDGGC